MMRRGGIDEKEDGTHCRLWWEIWTWDMGSSYIALAEWDCTIDMKHDTRYYLT
jgi:hypothetical protein